MKHNNTLIGIFTSKRKIINILSILKESFGVNLNKIRIYSINDDENEYLITIQVKNKEIYLKNIHGCTILHSKNNCLFSINALNKLIEDKNGMVSHDYRLNWEEYKNKLIMLINGQLNIHEIQLIEDKCTVIFQ